MKATDITRLCAIGLLLGLLVPACDRCEGDSDCENNYFCYKNTCQEEKTFCSPEYNVDDCEACCCGRCVSFCQEHEGCYDGICLPYSCEPACDAYYCEVCSEGGCLSRCSETEICLPGECVSTVCNQTCSGDMSFCNEIGECVSNECESMNCTDRDPNMHCTESTEGVSCVCNLGWVLHERSDLCVECFEDMISNNLQEPTSVTLPYFQKGTICHNDIFSFHLEAGTTVSIWLDEFNIDRYDLNIYLLSDKNELAVVESSEDTDGFEHILYTVSVAQDYYLIVGLQDGARGSKYRLLICRDGGLCRSR